MATYHLYFLRRGMLVGSSDIEAADDEAACRLAARHGGGDAVEVWNSHRRLRILAPTRASAGAEPLS